MHNKLHMLYEYWDAVRAGRLAPRRLEIEPSAIATLLADTFMLERLAGDALQFRLAGTRICLAYGRELRGEDFLAAFADADRAVLRRDLAKVLEHGAIMKIAKLAVADTRLVCEMETILLPLVHAGNSIGRVLGASLPVERPAWLGHHEIKRLKLITHEVVWPDGRPYAVVAAASEPIPFRDTPKVVRIVRSENRTFRVLPGGRSDD